jgi:hypothetical protein
MEPPEEVISGWSAIILAELTPGHIGSTEWSADRTMLPMHHLISPKVLYLFHENHYYPKPGTDLPASSASTGSFVSRVCTGRDEEFDQVIDSLRRYS